MIVITATFKAKAGHEQELEEILKSLIPDVQNEAGTLVYTLHKSLADPGLFLFYENYQDQEALNLHTATPYFKALGPKIKHLLEEKPTIAFFEDIAAIRR